VARSPVLAAVGLSIALGAGCGADAVGVDDCRKIEKARCEAASHCGDRFSITDVDACKRFYRNQCLHGLETGKSPGAGQVAACVRVIQTAGACAAQNSPTTTLAACGDPTLANETDPQLVNVCKVVETPELTVECAFLSGAATGGSGSGGSSAGGGGSGGLSDGGSNAGGAAGTGGA
jgi:hypothetical protein